MHHPKQVNSTKSIKTSSNRVPLVSPLLHTIKNPQAPFTKNPQAPFTLFYSLTFDLSNFLFFFTIK